MERIQLNTIKEELKKCDKGYVEFYDDWYGIFKLALKGMNYGEGNFYNTGEQNVVKIIKEKMADKAVVLFDVGANIGEYTNYLLQMFSDAEIHAFEPSEGTFGILNNNMNDSRVILNKIGLSNETKEAILYSDEDGSGLASLYKRQLDYYGIELSRQEKVALDTLDNYCMKKGIFEIDFLKMDVEGHEINVLQGGSMMLKEKRIRSLSFEFGGCNIDSRTYFRDFWNLLHENYNMFKICKNGMHKIERYSEKLEIFDCCNYFAELKE